MVEDLDVLIQLADRILGLCDGRVSGIVKGTKAKKKKLGRLMTTVGGKEEDDDDDHEED